MIGFGPRSEWPQSCFEVRRCAIQCFVFVSCVAGLSMQVAVGQAAPQSKRLPATLVSGEYLRSDYLATLRKTLSPMQSDVVNTPQLIKVDRIETGISLSVIFNFHEGAAVFAIAKDGSVENQGSPGEDTSNVKVTVIDEHHFRFGYASYPPATYTFVGDTEQYVAAVVLVGRYADDRGRNYIFGKDGWAIFPDRKFRYYIGIDHVLTGFDYFDEEQFPPKRVYAFKRLEGRLQIFETHGEDPWLVVDKRPLAVLHAVSFK